MRRVRPRILVCGLLAGLSIGVMDGDSVSTRCLSVIWDMYESLIRFTCIRARDGCRDVLADVEPWYQRPAGGDGRSGSAVRGHIHTSLRVVQSAGWDHRTMQDVLVNDQTLWRCILSALGSLYSCRDGRCDIIPDRVHLITGSIKWRWGPGRALRLCWQSVRPGN